MRRWCWIFGCEQEPVGESRFCRKHGWNQTGSDHVPPADDAPKKPACRPAIWSRESIVSAIRKWTAEHGRPPTQTEWVRRGESHPSATTVAHHFGTWTDGLKAAK